MRAKLVAAFLAAVLGLSLGQSAAAGGWDETSVTTGVIHVPTAVYYAAPLRHKHCARRVHLPCHARLAPNAHPYVVYRFAGTGYPRYHYRWHSYGWNR